MTQVKGRSAVRCGGGRRHEAKLKPANQGERGRGARWGQVGTIVQSQDALKLVFGLGLLFYGRSLPHLILFTHAFKVSKRAQTEASRTAPHPRPWPTPSSPSAAQRRLSSAPPAAPAPAFPCSPQCAAKRRARMLRRMLRARCTRARGKGGGGGGGGRLSSRVCGVWWAGIRVADGAVGVAQDGGGVRGLHARRQQAPHLGCRCPRRHGPPRAGLHHPRRALRPLPCTTTTAAAATTTSSTRRRRRRRRRRVGGVPRLLLQGA
jgi:hypothetical protein